ncbi:vasopressin V2 receptor [Bombina bombina]|uniref:vasopressin V2 receptor n=1 Tax=Bombina bombina TaxID=8345 RepID=UPI00235AB15C|nr:vasopressin V2 receptor [Bombina bombina]XP_053551584.1 vasopressin V2 receptor [Bombina bombina]XP_053551585.1 vasopressin V2 receptor [Bombina bombina]XP_053551586.1 vasopressin V2 receptor [Bombina bombina]XP_053551587.1 vasopressin V2 receptor [Bombina bombina]
MSETPSPFESVNVTTAWINDDRDPYVVKWNIGILALIFAFATFGNCLVLFTLLRRRKHNALMHTFMIHLCLADLVVSFFQVLPQLVWDITDRFQGPDVVCRGVRYLQVVGMFASSYMIVAMTFDRHQAICRPMMTFKKGSARWNVPVCLAWLISAILSLPQIFIFSMKDVGNDVYDCWATFVEPWGVKAYVTWTALVVFILPTLFIATCQVLIFREIHNSLYLGAERSPGSRRKGKLMGSRNGVPPLVDSGVTSAMSKTVRMTLVIVLIYVVCWAPFFIAQLWNVWKTKQDENNSVMNILMLLASLNSCTNPWIYTIFSSSVSKDVQAILCCMCRTKRRKNSLPEDSCFTGNSSLPKESLY